MKNLQILLAVFSIALSSPVVAQTDELHWSNQLKAHTRSLLESGPKSGDSLKTFLAEKPNEEIDQYAQVFASVDFQLSSEEARWLESTRKPLEALQSQFLDIYIKTFFSLTFIPLEFKVDGAQNILSVTADTNLESLARLSLNPSVIKIEKVPPPANLPLVSLPATPKPDRQYYPRRIHSFVRSFLGANQAEEFKFPAVAVSDNSPVWIQIGSSAPKEGFRISVLDQSGRVLTSAEVAHTSNHIYFSYGVDRVDRAEVFTENIRWKREEANSLEKPDQYFQLRRTIKGECVVFELSIGDRTKRGRVFRFSPEDLAKQQPNQVLRMTD